MLQKENEIYEFGAFRLDVKEHTFVRKDGASNGSLPDKAFTTLCLLVRNSGHLLTKGDLLEQVWPDSIVEENNLDKCIHAIRHALGEKPGEQKFIETVRKHGYRFVAEVRQVESNDLDGTGDVTQVSAALILHSVTHGPFADHTPANPESDGVLIDSDRTGIEIELREAVSAPSTVESKRPLQRSAVIEFVAKNRARLGAAAAVLSFIGVIALSYSFLYPSKTAVGGKKSIAVLPLKPINTANRDVIYEIGIADSLIHKLSSMKGLSVRPLSSTRKYVDIGQDPIAAGKEQQVDYVLASNYQLAEGKIRITAQLFNVASGQVEETYKSEKDTGDVFAIQDSIASEVGNILLARFAITSSNPVAKRGTTNEEAYRLYLQGMYIYENGENFKAIKAVEAFEQAVRLDPNYAAAWAAKARAHAFFAGFGRHTNIQEHYQKSIEAINKALALDEKLADALSAFCAYKMDYEYDLDGAERECKRAIELDPNSATAHEVYSRYLSSRGRFDEAISEMKTSRDLEPASLLTEAQYGISLYYARRYEEAATQFKRVIAMDEDFGPAYPWLYTTLSFQGKHDEAFEWYRRNEGGEAVGSLSTIYKESGWLGILRVRVKNFEEGGTAYYFGASFNAQVGNKEKAFEYLEKAYQRRESRLVYLQVDPRFDALRNDPRFDEFVRRIGLN